MRRSFILALAAALLLACSTSSKPAERRALLRETSPGAVQIVPVEGQLPYCLVFTVSRPGVVRLRTASVEDLSVPCKAGQPIGEAALSIPPGEGPVRIHVLFSDRPLEARLIDEQIRDLAKEKPAFTAMDLRAPGQVLGEIIEFTPASARSSP